MGCGTSSVRPNIIRVRHALVTETASPFTKVKAYDAIKNDDIFLVEKILQEIPAIENLGYTGDNSTCLHVAAQQNSFQAMKALILWLKANKSSEIEQIMEIQNSDGYTPVTLCIKNDASETFYVMLTEKVVKRDYQNKQGQSLLEICQQYSFNCLELLSADQKQGQTNKTVQIKKPEDEPKKDENQPNQQKTVQIKKPEDEPKKDENQPNQQKIVIQKQPIDTEKEHREKKVEVIVAKVEKVQIQTNEELNNIKSSKNVTSTALQGIPADSKVYKILSNLIKTDGEFVDPEFPRSLSSITTESSHKYYDRFQSSVWKRPHELFQCDYDQIALFDTIDANDISQGLLGVCYYLSSLSALTEFPSRLTKMFVNKVANKHGVYGILFYVRGVPTEIIIDDAFPCYGDRKNEPLFSKPKGKELWVLLAEKAWGKLFNNYVACEAGLMHEALEYMLATPAFTHLTNKQETEEIFRILAEGDAAKHILCAGTNASASKSMGLVANHAYSVISVHDVGKYKIVKLRNPWGKFEWTGDFGDSSKLWTDEFKAKVGYTNADDGVFCMTIEDFKKHFEFYSICVYNEGWEYSYCEAESDPNHAEYFKFTINQPCDVYFRIHQEDKRKLPEEKQKDHKYTGGDLSVARIEKDGTYKPVVEKGTDIDNSSIFGDRSIFASKTLKVELKTPGEYVIRTKLRWRSGKRDKFTLSAYSPIKINIQPMSRINDFLPKFFTTIGRLGTKKTMTQGCDMSYGFYSHYLYLYFENSTNETWTLNIKFTELKNLRLPKPYGKSEKSLSVTVPPKQSQIKYLKKIGLNEATSYSWSIQQSLQ